MFQQKVFKKKLLNKDFIEEHSRQCQEASDLGCEEWVRRNKPEEYRQIKQDIEEGNEVLDWWYYSPFSGEPVRKWESTEDFVERVTQFIIELKSKPENIIHTFKYNSALTVCVVAWDCYGVMEPYKMYPFGTYEWDSPQEFHFTFNAVDDKDLKITELEAQVILLTKGIRDMINAIEGGRPVDGYHQKAYSQQFGQAFLDYLHGLIDDEEG